LAGALRTEEGFARGLSPQPGRAERERWEVLRTSVTLAGPFAVHRVDEGPWSLVWPAPSDSVALPGRRRGETTLAWLEPRAVEGVRGAWGLADDERRATDGLLWGHRSLPAKALPGDRWWSSREVLAWLGDPHDKGMSAGRIRAPVDRFDLHVGLDPATLTAEEGRLFGHDTWEYRALHRVKRDAIQVEEFGVALRAEGATVALPAWWRLGGEARLAHAEPLGADVFTFPEELALGAEERVTRFRLVLATPAFFETGWRPDWLTPCARDGRWSFEGELPVLGARVRLRAACVERATPTSGWDFQRRGPKPTRRLVAAGSVYFFETVGEGIDATAWRSLWLATMQRADTDAARDGFGRMVAGRWPEGDPSAAEETKGIP